MLPICCVQANSLLCKSTVSVMVHTMQQNAAVTVREALSV